MARIIDPRQRLSVRTFGLAGTRHESVCEQFQALVGLAEGQILDDDLGISRSGEHIGPAHYGECAEVERSFFVGFQMFAHGMRIYQRPPEADGLSGTRETPERRIETRRFERAAPVAELSRQMGAD